MTRLHLALLATIGIAALSPASASAELPPKHQRLAELRAVLDHSGVADALGDALIDRVEFVRRDLYRVRAGRCYVDAAIVGMPMPPGMVGARRFEVRPGRRVCR
jgi:hypothetical protein